MKAKKIIGIIVLGIAGASSAVWAVDTTKAPKEQTIQQAVCPYNNHEDKHVDCGYDKDHNSCGHWYSRLSPGHKNRCNWNGEAQGSCCR